MAQEYQSARRVRICRDERAARRHSALDNRLRHEDRVRRGIVRMSREPGSRPNAMSSHDAGKPRATVQIPPSRESRPMSDQDQFRHSAATVDELAGDRPATRTVYDEIA